MIFFRSVEFAFINKHRRSAYVELIEGRSDFESIMSVAPAPRRAILSALLDNSTDNRT